MAEVVPAVEAGVALAAQVAGHSPVAVRLARQAVRSSEELPVTPALAQPKSSLATVLSTEDHVEGINAFLEMRPATFGCVDGGPGTRRAAHARGALADAVRGWRRDTPPTAVVVEDEGHAWAHVPDAADLPDQAAIGRAQGLVIALTDVALRP